MSTSTLQNEPTAESILATELPPPAPSTRVFVARWKRPLLIAAAVVAAIAVACYAYDAWTHEETDDAYVTGHLHYVAPRISEVVTGVEVDDNQFVHRGDVLVKLDPNDYLALEAAAKANLAKAEADLGRERRWCNCTPSRSRTSMPHAAAATSIWLRKSWPSCRSITPPSARPTDGYIGRKNVEVGNRVSSGQTLMVVVEPDLWVVGNFKETQLAGMRVGPTGLHYHRLDSREGFPGSRRQLRPGHRQRIRLAARR